MNTPTTNPPDTDHVPFADLPAEMRREMARAAIAARDTAALSPANSTLTQIVALLSEAADLASQWLEDGHGGDCLCSFCRWHPEVDGIAFDVSGAAWAARTTFGALDTATVSTWAEASADIEKMKAERDAGE